MSELDPRIEKILKYRNWAMVFNGLAASALAYFLFALYFEFSTPGFVISLVCGSMIVRALNFISVSIIQYRVYKGDMEQLQQDLSDAVGVFERMHAVKEDGVTQLSLTIEKMPDTPLGKFMDSPFYEWLEMKGADNIPRKFFFAGTMDVSRGLSSEIPPGTIMFHPGILYQIEKLAA